MFSYQNWSVDKFVLSPPQVLNEKPRPLKVTVKRPSDLVHERSAVGLGALVTEEELAEKAKQYAISVRKQKFGSEGHASRSLVFSFVLGMMFGAANLWLDLVRPQLDAVGRLANSAEGVERWIGVSLCVVLLIGSSLVYERFLVGRWPGEGGGSSDIE